MWCTPRIHSRSTSFYFICNDICNVSPLLFMILFADDTCVLLSGNNLNTLVALRNTELISLNNWFKANKLSLNTKKSFFMIFHRSRIKTNSIGTILLDNAKLIKVDYVKYLGVIIDHKLNWIEHIAYVKNKIMYKARLYLSKCTLLDLYYAYIYPYMTYCIEIWGSATQPHLNCLFLQQQKNIRIMNFSHYLAHTSPLFFFYGSSPFKKIYYRRIGLMMYKFNNNLLPNCLSQLYERTDSVHHHNTRGCQLLRVPTGTKTFSNMSARVWNALSNKIDSNTSRAVFKDKLKLFLLNNELVLCYPK